MARTLDDLYDKLDEIAELLSISQMNGVTQKLDYTVTTANAYGTPYPIRLPFPAHAFTITNDGQANVQYSINEDWQWNVLRVNETDNNAEPGIKIIWVQLDQNTAGTSAALRIKSVRKAISTKVGDPRSRRIATS